MAERKPFASLTDKERGYQTTRVPFTGEEIARTYDPELAQAGLEQRRTAALQQMVGQEILPAWQQAAGPGGYERRAAPIEALAQQRMTVPYQAGQAYAQTAGVSGPAGAPFPGAASLPILQARQQAFVNQMNLLTGPMAQEIAMLDEEALQAWLNRMNEYTLGSREPGE